MIARENSRQSQRDLESNHAQSIENQRRRSLSQLSRSQLSRQRTNRRVTDSAKIQHVIVPTPQRSPCLCAFRNVEREQKAEYRETRENKRSRMLLLSDPSDDES